MLAIRKMKMGAMIAVISLGVTTASPVQAADAEDLLGVIIGLAAIAAIANELDDDKDKVHRSHRSYDNRRYFENTRRHGRRALPAECAWQVDTRRGLRTVLVARCLERNGVRTARLPDRCERRAELRRGVRTVFGARCLEKAGYRIGQRRALRY